MVIKKGITVWISVFMTFLTIIFSFTMGYLLLTQGADSIVRPYIIGTILGDLSVESYLWISLTSTFIFLGITCAIIYRRQPPNPEIVKMFLKVGGNLTALKRTQDVSITEISDQLEHNSNINRKLFGKVSIDLQESTNSTITHLENNSKNIRKIKGDLISIIEKNTAETSEKLSENFKKQEKIIKKFNKLSEENIKSLNYQMTEIDIIKSKLEKIENSLVIPIPARIKSLDDIEEIKGIGPALGKELKETGIKTIGDFLITDASSIAERTRVSREMAENLQSIAQLMMIPGIDPNDAELLIESGITSRSQLAKEDSIQLSRRVGEIAKIFVDQGKISKDEYPTLEEISSWIRKA